MPASMFDALSERLRRTLGALTGRGRVSEADVDTALREIRLALLEADVNFKVVKEFVARVRERAIGAEILESLTAGQQVVKIVHEELTALLSAGDRTFHLSGSPAIVALVGLQGSGKTTSAAKLARHASARPASDPAADPYRPAAGDQPRPLGARWPAGPPRGGGNPRRGDRSRRRRCGPSPVAGRRHPRHRGPAHDRRCADDRAR
jgi:signal recognition particle subunit SRP54